METESPTAMRFLIACETCKRQYDATDLKPGSRFHCLCGLPIKVPRPDSHSAAVVRCSSCGAPRPRNAEACGHCGAGFTLHERDLHTICPECMARVSDSARYCHHCATALLPQGSAGARTEFPCPACGTDQHLNGRSLGEPPVSVLECPRCTGLWLGANTFEALIERARTAAPPEETGPAPESQRPGTAAQKGPLYRNCPECAGLMNRRNYGRRSGIVIDVCREDGVWFDCEELERILRWVRQGGEARSRERDEEARRTAESRDRFARAIKATEWQSTDSRLSDGSFPDLLGGLLGSFFRS